MSELKKLDEERSQSWARVAISIISLVAFSLVGHFRSLDADTLVSGLTTIVAYLAFSAAWYVLVCRFPDRWIWRRNISLVADLGIMTLFLHLGGKYAAAFYPIFLWIIIGNGIRFGERFLIKGLLLGSVGFGSLLILDEYWRDNMEVAVGLLLGVVVLPVFYQGVLRRLRVMSQLEIALAESRLADKAKDQFLATMSHEIRTPMNGVLGMAQALGTTRLDDLQREHLHIITRSVESLLNIINDILDYSKITSHGLQLESVDFDLHRLLLDVHSLLESTAESKGIELEFDWPEGSHCHFQGDPTRVRQIIFNLVGNAIKFTETGRVAIACEVRPGSHRGNVRVAISDTGIGIPEERLAAVFRQFEQADNSTTRQYGGTGLGLAISQRLVQMMAGNIEVESTVGQGSTFTVHLTLPTAETPLTCEPLLDREEELPQFDLKALVVEDNKFNQVVVKTLLQRIGIAVDIAENGAEALARLEDGNYDVIFMDVRMPIMNGYEATRTIRQRPDELARIPILAVTADATRSDVEKSKAAGMDVHLSKPLRLPHVIEALSGIPALNRQTV